MNRPKPEVGQKLWEVPRDSRMAKARWVEVRRVGRSYFYVGPMERRHRLGSWMHDDPGGYSSRYDLYLSEEECVEKNKSARLARAISKELSYGAGARSLEQLEQAAKILEIEVE